MGETFDDPSEDLIEAVLRELDGPIDQEHTDVSATHHSGWCLTAFPSGLLVWEDLDEDAPRHMRAVSRPGVRSLWLALAAGNLATIESQAWAPGYG